MLCKGLERLTVLSLEMDVETVPWGHPLPEYCTLAMVMSWAATRAGTSRSGRNFMVFVVVVRIATPISSIIGS